MVRQLKKACFMWLELIARMVISPFLRARLLRWFGASVGRNVRIYEVQFLNLSAGFRNLTIEDDVHIGMGCRIDLEGPVTICRGATISPGVTMLTHADPGAYHHSAICTVFEPQIAGVEIGSECWIGCNATIMPGSRIGGRTVVGACALVRGTLEAQSLYVGIPVRKIRSLTFTGEPGARTGGEAP